MNKVNKWASVRIPSSLHERVREFVLQPDSGYVSMSSFFAEAIRIRIDEIKKTRAIVEASKIDK